LLQKQATLRPVANGKQLTTPAVAPPSAIIEPAPPTYTAASAPIDSATNAPVATADPTPPKPPLPKLQGIFYRPERPSAVINGKTAFIGSRIGEYQILAITQESVTIGSAIQTNVLVMGE